jgi:hypothetical protein
MAHLPQLDLAARGGEARLRALIEDLLPELVEYYKGLYPRFPLALAVWFGKSPGSTEHSLLVLFSGSRNDRIEGPTRVSVHWKTGSEGPPFLNVYATSVDHFAQELRSNRQGLDKYFENAEVLYFNKELLLNTRVLEAFRVITEPEGLIKGWYISPEEYAESITPRSLLAAHGHTRPEIGLVKIQESADFETCRGLLHAEVSQTWLPLSPEGLSAYTFFNDLQAGRPGCFLFEGGAVYRLLKFEVKTAPEYSTRVLEKPRDDRYPEVYLRAVYAPEQPAA